MQFNGVNNKERKCCSVTRQRCLFKRMRQNSMCSQNIRRSRCVGEAKRFRGGFWRQEASVSPLPPPPSFLSPLFISVTGACSPSRAWGVMAGLPGFASHGSGHNLRAGCQWKVLPLSDAVVNSPFQKILAALTQLRNRGSTYCGNDE